MRVRKRVGTVSVRSRHRIGGSPSRSIPTCVESFSWRFTTRASAGGPGPGPPPLAWGRTFRTRGRGTVQTLIRRRIAFVFTGLLHLRGDVCVRTLATRGACASSCSPASVATRLREIPGPRRGRNRALPLFSDSRDGFFGGRLPATQLALRGFGVRKRLVVAPERLFRFLDWLLRAGSPPLAWRLASMNGSWKSFPTLVRRCIGPPPLAWRRFRYRALARPFYFRERSGSLSRGFQAPR